MNNAIGQVVRAAKVILYLGNGEKFVYKMGDPESTRELQVMIEIDSDFDEVYNGTLMPTQYLAGKHTKITIKD